MKRKLQSIIVLQDEQEERKAHKKAEQEREISLRLKERDMECYSHENLPINVEWLSSIVAEEAENKSYGRDVLHVCRHIKSCLLARETRSTAKKQGRIVDF